MSAKVQQILAHSAEAWPQRAAVVDGRGVLDYGTLRQLTEDVRRQLQERGISEGHGVGVMARNGRSFIIGAFAALGCGATVLPMSNRLRKAEWEALREAAPLHAVFDDLSGPRLLGDHGHDVEVGGGPPMRLTWTGADRAKPFVDIVPDAAFVRFTSGTTGDCKGVVLSHATVLERISAANRGLALSCEDTVVWVLPMAFHFFVSIVLYLQVGATIAICPDHLAETLLNVTRRQGGTFVYASPLHYRLLAADASGRRAPTLRRAVSTSAALAPQTAQAFLERYGLPITQAYGIIEVGLPLINLDHALDRPESIGRPLPDYEVAILDENLRPVPSGSVGELALRGPGMFDAYMSPPRLRREVLRGGWFLTGDLARQDADGLVTLVGRCKAMINVAGNKVFPEEVEDVLNMHPCVALARVSARTHPQMGEVVHADIVLSPSAGGREIEVEQLLAFCRQRLSSYKVPQSVAFVESIEETPSGKVRRR
jgi:acyl-CoA synthetase (AMP-forming)/AMP-acid ligase II